MLQGEHVVEVLGRWVRVCLNLLSAILDTSHGQSVERWITPLHPTEVDLGALSTTHQAVASLSPELLLQGEVFDLLGGSLGCHVHVLLLHQQGLETVFACIGLLHCHFLFTYGVYVVH